MSFGTDLPQNAANRRTARTATWSADGNGIVYFDNKNGVGNLWLMPLNGGPSKQLTTFTSQEIFNFSTGSKPNQFVIARGETRSDLILIQNFR